MIDIDRQLIRSYGRIKLHKKDLEIYILFKLRKLSWLRDQFWSSALVESTKECLLLTQYYKINLLIEITFLSKKKYNSRYFLYEILCDQKLLITIFREKKQTKSIMLRAQLYLPKGSFYQRQFFPYFLRNYFILRWKAFATKDKGISIKGQDSRRRWMERWIVILTDQIYIL